MKGNFVLLAYDNWGNNSKVKITKFSEFVTVPQQLCAPQKDFKNH